MAQQQQGPGTEGPGTQGYGGQSSAPPGRVLTILGFVFGVLAILFFPYIIGLAGIICAGIAMSKGDPLAKWSLAVAIAGTVIGIILIAVVLNTAGVI